MRDFIFMNLYTEYLITFIIILLLITVNSFQLTALQHRQPASAATLHYKHLFSYEGIVPEERMIRSRNSEIRMPDPKVWTALSQLTQELLPALQLLDILLTSYWVPPSQQLLPCPTGFTCLTQHCEVCVA